MGQNFLAAASLDIILERGESWAFRLSNPSNDMSKLGLTAEKSDIESNFPPRNASKNEIAVDSDLPL